jgi:hypothetical protein
MDQALLFGSDTRYSVAAIRPETTGMAEWPLQLQEVFAEAVQLLLKCPAPVTKDEYHFAFVLMQLQESSAGNTQPTAPAQFILYLLRGSLTVA